MERVFRFITSSFFILLLFFIAANIKAQPINPDGGCEEAALANATTGKAPIHLGESANLPFLPVGYNIVKEIASGRYGAGEHRIKLNASGLSSGKYFYRLSAWTTSEEAGSFNSTKKLILLK